MDLDTYYHHAIEQVKWPCDRNVFPQDWPHDLWFTPDAACLPMSSPRRREDLVHWFSENQQDILSGLADYDEVGNFVRINMWSNHIQTHGIIKPILLHHRRSGLEVAVGSSRLMAIEQRANGVAVPAFISCRRNSSLPYCGMIPVLSLQDFASICQAEPGDVFLFRWSEPTADFALDWYEHDTQRTRDITPDIKICADIFRRYIDRTNAVIDIDWFDTCIDWSIYNI